jgi:ribosomal protein S18 acetylase RimI-like enzyme
MQKMDYEIRKMTAEDYDNVYAFWNTIGGLKLDESDALENFKRYLERNPRLSYIVTANDQIVGTIQCGHDGRRGYIYHLAVKEDYRNQGIAKKLFTLCVEELKREGILRCNLYMLNSNKNALSFWEHNGWHAVESNFRLLQKVIK